MESKQGVMNIIQEFSIPLIAGVVCAIIFANVDFHLLVPRLWWFVPPLRNESWSGRVFFSRSTMFFRAEIKPKS